MDSFKLNAGDGKPLHVYRWLPPETRPLATLQIAHGMGEHAARYDHTARAFTRAGYAVYANDHRGHGATAEPGRLGWMGDNGWNRVIADAGDLNDYIVSTHPGGPHVLLGHSMGAMLAQQFIYRFGTRIDAAVLSGSPGIAGRFRSWLSRMLAGMERWRLGAEAESPLMQKLIFGNANQAFEGENATGYEWLSRDAGQVAAYAQDPCCGFVLRSGSLADLFAGACESRAPRHVRQIPRSLPVYVFSGSDDPVHDGERNLMRLVRLYRDRLERVDYRIYPHGRHEMLNEINRDEVVQDLLSWLSGVLPVASRASSATAASPN